MIQLLKFWLRHLLFWLLFFLFFRIVLTLTINPADALIVNIFNSLVAGYRLDISTISYIFIVPFIILSLQNLIPFHTQKNIINYFQYSLIIIFTLLSFSNILIFKYWGTLINNRALAYVKQPAEMLASVTNWQLIILLLILSAICYSAIKIYKRVVLPGLTDQKNNFTKQLIASFILLSLTVVGMRGGIQQIPVNESSAVHSNNFTLNQIAINPIWYLGHNLYQSGLRDSNPYEIVPEQTAEQITHNLLIKTGNDTIQLFNNSSKPNIVILLLESWTADIIERIGGLNNVTPNFNRLSKDGLLFTSIYSSGFRTDQALVSVLSGFPAQPNNSIIRFPGKVTHLPSLANILKKEGYTTSFYYGGELGFANMNSYLTTTGYDAIISKDHFSDNAMNSKWGAHDEYVLNKQLDDFGKMKQPFFSTLLTLSTHEPFEVPVETPFIGSDEPELFKKAAWYTDKCLGEYFDKAKTQRWFNNTIFILVADHGHRLPMRRDYVDPRARQIPFLIMSNLLNENLKGQTNSTLANQHDIPSTLLRGLGLSDSSFQWSVDILNPKRNNFVYLSLDNAFTWKTDSDLLYIPLQSGTEKENATAIQNDTIPRAYLQHLYRTFLSY